MTKRYFTLVIHENGQWAPQFGDWNRGVVAQERLDCYGGRAWRILATDPSQSSINAAVSALNGATTAELAAM